MCISDIREKRAAVYMVISVIYLIVGLVLILAGVIQYVIDCRRYRCA